MNAEAAERALVAAAGRILEARGQHELARIVGSATVELLSGSEAWQIDERPITAQRFALVVRPEDFVKLREQSGAFDAVKDALAAVIETPSTRLAGLSLVVALDASGTSGKTSGRTWGHIYRSAAAPTSLPAEPARVLATAISLARAYGDPTAERVLGSAELARAEGASSSGIVLVRWIVALTPVDLVLAERSQALGDRIVRCVTHAATRANERVGEVELRAREERG